MPRATRRLASVLLSRRSVELVIAFCLPTNGEGVALGQRQLTAHFRPDANGQPQIGISDFTKSYRPLDLPVVRIIGQHDVEAISERDDRGRHQRDGPGALSQLVCFEASGADTNLSEFALWLPDDLAASFFHNIGIDPKTEFRANVGRPVTLVRDGSPIRPLF